MASPAKSHAGTKSPIKGQGQNVLRSRDEPMSGLENGRDVHSDTKTPEPRPEQQNVNANTPSTPGVLLPFDWDDFEARYEKALRDADDREKSILHDVDRLSKYFQAWASAASAHDDERAVKRLQTRQRHVNLSEEKMSQKQQHCDCNGSATHEVVEKIEATLEHESGI
ncbi:hypothetical protein HJFPF1_01183 [Paramyrothecium foliicola]|nr:hypothetical protein HJFPF1_01183 [Paramyrothecium foliicola]